MIRTCVCYSLIKRTSLYGLIMSIFCAFPAMAQDFRGQSYQDVSRTETVTERVHPDYATLGMHHGSFVLNPSVALDTAYNSNIFAISNNKTDDWVTVVEPALRLQNLPTTRHNFRADLSLRQGIYASNSSENYTDYSAGVASRLNARDTVWFDGGFTFNHIHEDRTSPNVAQTTAEPLEYDHTYASVMGTYKPGLMRASFGGTWDNYQFDNTAQTGGGQVIQNDRDRDEYRLHGEVAYEFRPQYEVFLSAGVNTIKYKRNEFVVGPNTYTGNNRDSDGFDVLGGVRFDITSMIRADLGVGYLAQSYNQTGLSDIDGFNLHGDLAWNVTPLTTLNLGFDRTVQETVSTGSSGYLETALNIGVDHELKRNIIVSVGAQYASQDYEGTNRQDDVLGFTTRGTYKMNRNMNWVLEYFYDQRDSNQTASDFDRNIIMLRAKFKL